MSAAVAGVLALVALAAPQELCAPATPESQGLEARWLDELGAVIQGWVDEQHIVGAELLVIRGDYAVFHRGYGWRHREEGVPMEPGGVFCLRSMTKAVVGAAVQMLIDDDALSAGDRVSEHIAAFDNPRSRTITVEQLLTHTSGLPLSSLLGRDMAALGGERAIADLTGEKGPEFAPGSGFHYSDDGADTLGALVELASEQALEDFLRARLFEPLGMRETAGVMAREHALRSKVCSAYAGGAGAWTRFFAPTDPPLFPFLLASQGLYGTALDYARFMRLWKERGRAGGERLLSARAVRHALTPVNRMGMPTGFDGLESHYGEMMMLWVDPAAEEDERVVAFGHGGSDGTMAWVFPALDLMVLYFTQSRNSLSVIEFETALQRHLLDPLRGRASVPPASYAPEELAAFTGTYWEEDDRQLRAVLRRGERLWMEFPGEALVELASTAERDRFTFRLSPDYRIDFERTSTGAITAFTGGRRGKGERIPRLAPAADLPDVAELVARKHAAVGAEGLATLGPVRIRATFEMPAVGVAGDCETLIDGLARLRSECDYGGTTETLVLDGARGWARLPGSEREELSGARLFDARVDHPLLVAADWRELYADLRVLARVERGGRAVYLVRGEPAEGYAHNWFVDAESALPLALETFALVRGMGELGTVTEFDDWRAVGAVRLPFSRSGRFATEILGTYEARWESAETGVTLPEDAFACPKDD